MHDHSESRDDNLEQRNLGIVSLMNLLGFIIEFTAGLLFGSVALIGDAVHMLFDSLAYILAFFASLIASRYDDKLDWSYGIHRLEPLAAFLNGILLIPMVGYILWESYKRFLSTVEITFLPVLTIAFGGLLVNIISVYVLHNDDMSLNERGAFYHLIGDSAGSIAVILSTIIIEFSGFNILDPIVASLICILIIWSSFKVIVDSSSIFLHRTPININSVRSDLIKIDGVNKVDDIHTWNICSQITVATVHINTEGNSNRNINEIIHETHSKLSEDYGVNHATVEICDSCGKEDAHIDEHTH